MSGTTLTRKNQAKITVVYRYDDYDIDAITEYMDPQKAEDILDMMRQFNENHADTSVKIGDKVLQLSNVISMDAGVKFNNGHKGFTVINNTLAKNTVNVRLKNGDNLNFTYDDYFTWSDDQKEALSAIEELTYKGRYTEFTLHVLDQELEIDSRSVSEIIFSAN